MQNPGRANNLRASFKLLKPRALKKPDFRRKKKSRKGARKYFQGQPHRNGKVGMRRLKIQAPKKEKGKLKKSLSGIRPLENHMD